MCVRACVRVCVYVRVGLHAPSLHHYPTVLLSSHCSMFKFVGARIHGRRGLQVSGARGMQLVSSLKGVCGSSFKCLPGLVLSMWAI